MTAGLTRRRRRAARTTSGQLCLVAFDWIGLTVAFWSSTINTDADRASREVCDPRFGLRRSISARERNPYGVFAADFGEVARDVSLIPRTKTAIEGPAHVLYDLKNGRHAKNL